MAMDKIVSIKEYNTKRMRILCSKDDWKRIVTDKEEGIQVITYLYNNKVFMTETYRPASETLKAKKVKAIKELSTSRFSISTYKF